MFECKMPRKLIALHILGLSGLLAMPAHAFIITNNLTASATAQAGSNAPTNMGPTSDSSYVNESASSNAGVSNTFASAWGNEFGVYRAAADGSGQFNSNGRFQRALTLTNNNDFAAAYSLSIFIYYGNMSVDSAGATGSGYASYDLSIKRDSNTLFSSYAKIDSDGILTQTGTALNGATQSGTYYSWDGTYVNFDLGPLGSGQSLTLDFDLVNTAYGDFDVSGAGNCYGSYGSELATTFSTLENGYGGCTGVVYSSLGDPFDVSDNNPAQYPFNPFNTLVINERRVPTNDVPLPGTLALLGIGLGGLGLLRKRRKG